MKLGVNIDHVATLRQARGEDEPDILRVAKDVLDAGADGITIHLREDRRHIQDKDVYDLAKFVPRLNLEMAIWPEIVDIACEIKPMFCCIVPEKRQELTTEGGLDVIKYEHELKKAIKRLQNNKIKVSLFIDPNKNQIKKAKDVGAEYIEIHTGHYANAKGKNQEKELQTIKNATKYALELGLKVNAGHGLKYYNVKPIAQISGIEELNIGHSIISRSIYVGIKQAVQEMKKLISL